MAAEGDSRGPKTTLPVENEKLAELARDSVKRPEPRAIGSNKMPNVGNAADEARPTTQMDPSELRALADTAVLPIDELGTQKATAQGMPPLARPPAERAPTGDVVELGADDRKSRKQRALATPGAAAAAVQPARPGQMTRTTWMLLATLGVVTIVAIIGWLR